LNGFVWRHNNPLTKMARSQSATARTTRDSTLCHDRFVDTSYFKGGSSEEQYLEAPWCHYKNPLASYLSLRFAEKDGFREKLKDVSVDDWDRVVHEIERVKLDRQKFLNDSKKKDLTKLLRDSYYGWRATVFSESELRDIKHDREKQVRKLLLNQADKSALQSWDSMHLQRLNDIVNARPPGPVSASRTFSASQHRPSQQAREDHGADDPYHGFRAGAMCFKKRMDGTLDGIDFSDEKYKPTKFPNQKIALADILDNAEGNPLSEKRPDGEVRYFHFPSNNMEWIEVRLPLPNTITENVVNRD
jgi:hypothetical protein